MIEIPEGMKPHDGSAKVPDDYDGGAVMLRASLLSPLFEEMNDD